MEGDDESRDRYNLAEAFQSTPSAWRETEYLMGIIRKVVFQSTPSAWRETIVTRIPRIPYVCISIHSLRMEGDRDRLTAARQFLYFNPLPPHGGRHKMLLSDGVDTWDFNPLPPHGGRPALNCLVLPPGHISIHSLRMEGDILCYNNNNKEGGDFNPLPPHGGRPSQSMVSEISKSFQSTPSAWRETY